MHHKVIMRESVDWVHSTQNKVQSCEHGNAHSVSIKGGNFLTELLLASLEGLCSTYFFRDI
jgi:hypothetical protein